MSSGFNIFFATEDSRTSFERLANAQHVIVIGHGPGSQHVMDLLERRCMPHLSPPSDYVLKDASKLSVS